MLDTLVRELVFQPVWFDGVLEVFIVGSLEFWGVYVLFLWITDPLLENIRSYERKSLRCLTMIAS